MATVVDPTDRAPARLRGVTGAAYRAALAGSIAALSYLVVLVAYLSAAGGDVLDPTRAAYPFVWIVLSVAALAAATAGSRRRTVPRWAAVLAAGYVLVLAWLSGQFTPGVTDVGLTVTGGLPGWGPVVVADIAVVHLVVVPFQTIGYLVLGVLLARALSVSGNSLVAGGLGLFACAGCVLPIAAFVASAAGVPFLAGSISYLTATVAFAVTTVALVAVIVRWGARPSCSVS